MINVSLVETILREQDDPGASTTRKIRELYNDRSGEDPIVQHSDVDKEFQSILMKALESYTGGEDDDKPISYTVKLKDSDENVTPAVKRRSIIKLPKENKSQSESDDASSDSEKIQTNSTITINKPFSPLFLNNMKKFGVSTDWLAKRSNSARHSSYSRSSIKSNTSQLDAMIKSASAKPIRSSRKLSFVETTNNKPEKLDFDKENIDPTEENSEQTKSDAVPTPYDLNSDTEDEKENQQAENSSSPPNEFSLRIERVDMVKEKKKRSSSSSSVSDEEKSSKPKKLGRPKGKSKKKEENKESVDGEVQDKKTTQKKEKNERDKGRIEHLKKLLRISGIRSVIRNAELEEFSSEKAKIKHLESLFDKAGFKGSLTLKECERFRTKRDEEKELLEIQAVSVKVKGHVKGGRTLRGRARSPDQSDSPPPIVKRKRKASEDVQEIASSTDDDVPIAKKQRIRKMEASPEVSENEID